MIVAFTQCILYKCQKILKIFSCYRAGVTWNGCRLSHCSVYTTLKCHPIQNHIHRVNLRLAATRHKNFWLNDQGLSAVAQSDFMRSKKIMCVVYISWSSFRNLILRTHGPEQLSSMIGCRKWCALQRNLWKASAQIRSQCYEDGISHPTKGEIFSVLPIAFPLLMRHFELMHSSMSHILPWATEKP